jgi:hypothetical protein
MARFEFTRLLHRNVAAAPTDAAEEVGRVTGPARGEHEARLWQTLLSPFSARPAQPPGKAAQKRPKAAKKRAQRRTGAPHR